MKIYAPLQLARGHRREKKESSVSVQFLENVIIRNITNNLTLMEL